MDIPHVRLPDGTLLPAIGQGTWHLGEGRKARRDEVDALIHGLDRGLKVIDTAEMYGNGGSEEVVGEALKQRRDDAFLVTKMLPGNTGHNNIVSACERSLRRLQTDVIDLYLLHWRGAYPLEAVMESFGHLRDEGKIRYFGVSNLDIGDMKELRGTQLGRECVTNQVLYHLASRGIEFSLRPSMARWEMPLMAYSPLAQHMGKSHQSLHRDSVLTDIAAHRNASVEQILLAWAIRPYQGHHTTLAIPKATSIEHIDDNADAMTMVLTDHELALLDEAFPAPKQKVPLDLI
ncbi:aldo/keto reductase [Larsenimonas rhizosphaerae]|uniref:aldo/keto reductase n=1 Tax=Larsenimonas rhizosphaerae TaxID=2944682 RepID=UPI0020343127|nr:aldo/keto reductase [Larsenimonas rhizosphaerae]MCM2130304.1 aldo/keto reductase [Larsenimonas rhizosphaerae]